MPKAQRDYGTWRDTYKTKCEEAAFDNRAVSAFRKALRHEKLKLEASDYVMKIRRGHVL
ncbi:MAG: hypothetical protein WCE81_04045 [Halobacteriota archaeon]